MSYHWRWGVFLEPTPSGATTYLGWMLAGVHATAAPALTSWLVALAVGTAMGVSRTVPGRLLRAIGAAYVEVFRNVPLLVQLFIWYFVVPDIVPARLGSWLKGLHPFTQQFL